MKPYQASATQITRLTSYSSQVWLSASSKIPRNNGYPYQIRSFSGITVTKSLKRHLPVRGTALTLSLCIASRCLSFSAFSLSTKLDVSNQAESSTFSQSRQSTTACNTTSQAEKYNPLINPPSITLPPPLHVPERTPDQLFISYLYSRGRAYLNFFKGGLRNVWTMRKIAREIKKKEKESDSQHMSLSLLTRAEFQLLQRNEAALSKVLPFGLFIFIFAEFSPLLLVFITSIVPEPCQLPSVQAKIEKKFNERKFKSFIRYKEYVETTERGREDKRMLRAESADALTVSSSLSPLQQQDPKTSPSHSLLITLSTPSLHHASTAIKAHPAILDRLSYIPLLSYISSLILTRNYFINRIHERINYLRADDVLLLRDGSVDELTPQELKRAVAERGYLAESSLGVSEAMMMKQMKDWLGSSMVKKGGKDGEERDNGLLKLILDG